MVRKGDGVYLDIILWESQDKWDAAMAKAQTSEAVGAYFSHMVIDPENMEEGVERCMQLRSFAKG
ncbi:MAG: hypothetical protein AAF066_01710 [Pseudomonadota bacterium]